MSGWSMIVNFAIVLERICTILSLWAARASPPRRTRLRMTARKDSTESRVGRFHRAIEVTESRYLQSQ